MAIEIVYETHATTEDNESGMATGWLPGRLSDVGRANAALLSVGKVNGSWSSATRPPAWVLSGLSAGKTLNER